MLRKTMTHWQHCLLKLPEWRCTPNNVGLILFWPTWLKICVFLLSVLNISTDFQDTDCPFYSVPGTTALTISRRMQHFYATDNPCSGTRYKRRAYRDGTETVRFGSFVVLWAVLNPLSRAVSDISDMLVTDSKWYLRERYCRPGSAL